jgi:hypothetical protein
VPAFGRTISWTVPIASEPVPSTKHLASFTTWPSGKLEELKCSTGPLCGWTLSLGTAGKETLTNSGQAYCSEYFFFNRNAASRIF